LEIHVNECNADHISGLIRRDVHADYVYMYPPRQSYRGFRAGGSRAVEAAIQRSLAASDDLNLYVHVPFCRQICAFCNLYTTNDLRRDTERYIDAVLREATWYEGICGSKHLKTLYLGGGTPSILLPAQIERLLKGLVRTFSPASAGMPLETALEVDPATVDAAKLHDLCAAGINRINLGYQSLVAGEVALIGRKRNSGLRLLEDALLAGFDNVCVDLIYGLRQQTDQSWAESVSQVAAIRPPTVCAYSLTLRPFTGYHRHGYRSVDGATLYRRYETANDLLLSAGYRRETHVRWVRPNGGYQQKVNHWNLENILGLGAGARGYLWEIDLRNGYSIRSRTAALDGYMERIRSNLMAATEGFLMSEDERMRKAAALNVGELDRGWFSNIFGTDPASVFQKEYEVMEKLGACDITSGSIRLAEPFYKYRDLFSQLFFSSDVAGRIRAFDYRE
jgi:oxygen-independent coproporphyrinogen III oxidase